MPTYREELQITLAEINRAEGDLAETQAKIATLADRKETTRLQIESLQRRSDRTVNKLNALRAREEKINSVLKGKRELVAALRAQLGEQV